MSFKDISFLELWLPFCSAEQNHLCNFARNNSVKLFWFLTSDSGDVISKISKQGLSQPSCSVEQNHLCNFEIGHHGEHSCEVICNLDPWFRRCCLKIFLIWSSGGPFDQWSNHLCNFARRNQEEQFCEIILNLDRWFRRSHSKDFLSGALASLLFCGMEPFTQFWKRASWETFMWSYMKFGPVVKEETTFKKKFMDRRMTHQDQSQ